MIHKSGRMAVWIWTRYYPHRTYLPIYSCSSCLFRHKLFTARALCILRINANIKATSKLIHRPQVSQSPETQALPAAYPVLAALPTFEILRGNACKPHVLSPVPLLNKEVQCRLLPCKTKEKQKQNKQKKAYGQTNTGWGTLLGLIKDNVRVDAAYVFIMHLTERSPSFCSSTM